MAMNGDFDSSVDKVQSHVGESCGLPDEFPTGVEQFFYFLLLGLVR
jgi:hypothetical protein